MTISSFPILRDAAFCMYGIHQYSVNFILVFAVVLSSVFGIFFLKMREMRLTCAILPQNAEGLAPFKFAVLGCASC